MLMRLGGADIEAFQAPWCSMGRHDHFRCGVLRHRGAVGRSSYSAGASGR